jgi:hypothetical protein
MRLVSRKWKYGNAIAVCVMAIALGQIGSAQESRDNQQATPPAAQPAQKPAEEPVTRVIAPAAMMQIPALKNIQVDITIIDQVGSEPPLKKTLSVIAVDAGSGSVRSKGFIAVPKQEPASRPGDYYYEELPLNVDIRPQVTENKNRIRMRLILNYETFRPKTTGLPPVRSVVTVDQNVMLDNGKPMIVSQSADATTDRKVSVELKATILP